MSETHPAYWDLFSTIDHVVPMARGGADSEESWVTTSMRLNAAKDASTLEQTGWSLHLPGDLAEWDGLTGWLMDSRDKHPTMEHAGAHQKYILRWWRASRRALTARS